MSFTQHAAIATSRQHKFLDLYDFCSALYTHTVNDETAPEELRELETASEFADLICDYIELIGGELTVKFDTEEANNNTEIFDYITTYAAERMDAPFMKIMWISSDSREGLSADCTYYDNQNNLINVEQLICKVYGIES